MNNIAQLNPYQRIEIASRWVLRIDEGLTAADEQELRTWLETSSENRAALLEVASAWDKLDSLTRLALLFPLEDSRWATKPAANDSWSVNWAIAASFVIVVPLLLWMLTFSNPEHGIGNQPIIVETSSLKTERGKQQTAVLSDGSEVTLNTDSAVRLAFTPHSRVIHLDRGELFIDVAKDEKRPLSVLAGDQVVRAVGTAFSVQLMTDDYVQVMVSEGEVRVGAAEGHVDPLTPQYYQLHRALQPPAINEASANTLVAGDVIKLGTSDTDIEQIPLDEIERKQAWRAGRLIFVSEPLDSVLTNVARYTDMEFVLLNDSLRSLTLSGRFKVGDVEALLSSLQVNFNITHKYDDDGRVLLSIE